MTRYQKNSLTPGVDPYEKHYANQTAYSSVSSQEGNTADLLLLS